MQSHNRAYVKDQTQSALIVSKSPEVIAADEQRKIAKHHEIARRYAWDDRQRRERGRYPRIVNFRLRDLENLFAHRYGPTLPDDDAGRGDLYVVACHIFHIGSPEVHIPAWARLWCPWLGEHECDTLIADVTRTRQRWGAEALAKLMRLDDATRTLLGISTIGAIDVSKAKRAKRAKRRDAAYQKARRVKAGAKPHAASAERTKPWEALGISRRAYYRNRANGTLGTNSSAPDRVYVGTTNPCHTAGAWPSGQSAASGLAPCPAFNTDIAAASNNVLQLFKRDSAFAGRLRLHWITKGTNPADTLPLAALESKGMGCAT